MSPGARKSGGGHRRTQARLARETAGRKLKRTVLIVTEARETEPNYFRGLRDDSIVSDRFAVTVKSSKGKAPSKTVQKAISDNEKQEGRGEAYDKVWCILDVEERDNREQIDAALKLADDHGIKVCLSNPCFEVWLLFHFDEKIRGDANSSQVIELVRGHWTKHCKTSYEKNDDQLYTRIAQRTETAITNARSVLERHHRDEKNRADCNSSTDVYRLVEYLITPPKSGS